MSSPEQSWAYRNRALIIGFLSALLLITAVFAFFMPWKSSIQSRHDIWVPEDYFEQETAGKLAHDWLLNRSRAIEVSEETFLNIKFDQTLILIGSQGEPKRVVLTYIGKQNNKPLFFFETDIEQRDAKLINYWAASWELQGSQLTVFLERAWGRTAMFGLLILVLAVLFGWSTYDHLK